MKSSLSHKSFSPGPFGVNHGIEIHADVIRYAQRRLENFVRSCPDFERHDFSAPTFVHGNCMLLRADSPTSRLYDRVYCGAACSEENEDFMKNLIKVGGILVMPIQDKVREEGEVVFSREETSEGVLFFVSSGIEFCRMEILHMEENCMHYLPSLKSTVLCGKEFCNR